MLIISGKDIARKIIFHDNVWSQGTGLMFHRKPKGEVHIFRFKKPRKIQVTMMFVFFSLDLLFLDENGIIVELKRSIRPFSDYYPKKEATILIELEAGSIKKFKIKEGQKAEF